MDTALLSKMVGELILDHDQVELPGLGSFTADIVPASFSDRGYTINPPYRRLSFHQGKSGDNLLVGLYARSNGITEDTARVIIVQFLSELKDKLKSEKTVIFPGLGRLRATKENNFFFVCNEDLNIFPDGIGLESISLKNHVETGDEISQAVSSLAEILEPVPAVPVETAETPAPAEEPEAAESAETPAPAEEPEPEPKPEIPATSAETPATEPAAEPAGNAETAETTEPEPAEAAETAETPAPAEEPEPATGPAAPAMKDYEIKYYASCRPELAHKKKKKKSRLWWIIPLTLVIIAAVALAVFLILAQVAPDFIDSILYTPEELRIINY